MSNKCIYIIMDLNDFEACESCVCFSARKAARLLTQHFDKHLRPVGLRATQYTLLVMLIRLGKSASLNRISELLGLERTTLTRNLQPLVAKGYIQIESKDSDKRKRLVILTKQGLAKAQEAFPIWEQAQQLATQHIPSDILKGFANTTALIQ